MRKFTLLFTILGLFGCQKPEKLVKTETTPYIAPPPPPVPDRGPECACGIITEQKWSGSYWKDDWNDLVGGVPTKDWTIQTGYIDLTNWCTGNSRRFTLYGNQHQLQPHPFDNPFETYFYKLGDTLCVAAWRYNNNSPWEVVKVW